MEDKEFCQGIRRNLAFIRAAMEVALPTNTYGVLSDDKQEEGMFMEAALPDSYIQSLQQQILDRWKIKIFAVGSERIWHL